MNFGETKISDQVFIGDVFCPTNPNQKCIYMSTSKIVNFFDWKNCKALSHMPNVPFKDQKIDFYVVWL